MVSGSWLVDHRRVVTLRDALLKTQGVQRVPPVGKGGSVDSSDFEPLERTERAGFTDEVSEGRATDDGWRVKADDTLRDKRWGPWTLLVRDVTGVKKIWRPSLLRGREREEPW